MKVAGSQRGSVLLESLVSAALILMVLAAVAPVLLGSRQLLGGAVRRAMLTDAALLSARRFVRESRLAGFGLAAGAPAVSVNGGDGSVTLMFAEGGFDGGHALAELLPAGGQSVALVSLGTLRDGDQVIVSDRWGRVWSSLLVRVERAERRVWMADAIPHSTGPDDGARLHRIVSHRWLAGATGLRRDGQPLADPPAALAVVGEGQASTVAGWVAWSAGQPLDDLVDDEQPTRLVVGAVQVGGAGPTDPRLTLPVTTRLRQAGRAAGSPLP